MNSSYYKKKYQGKRVNHRGDVVVDERYPLLLIVARPSSSTSPSSRASRGEPGWHWTVSTLVLALLIGGALSPFLHRRDSSSTTATVLSSSLAPSSPASPRPPIDDDDDNGGIPLCDDSLPCFSPERTQVPRNILPGVPSFWNFNGPMNVSYDSRSILINGERVLLLGGSMHPVRATRATWEKALDEAVRNGLNLITIYVIWSAHQPFEDAPLDWRLPTSLECESNTIACIDWTLAQAITSAANRGLFVHIRVGPYDCAEYSYGGIPEWLPLKYPEMRMRRVDPDWLRVMKEFVTATVQYLSQYNLWAHQGGPIILAQIENELGSEDDEANEKRNGRRAYIDLLSGEFVFFETSDTRDLRQLRNATLQDYANWCGKLATELVPNVVWTMCNGLSAPETVSTFNGDWFAPYWLEQQTRIQVDQPAMWTENEGGFQIWGEQPNQPSDYFWGRTAREMAYRNLQWLARGGTHFNYYMWWGGYNRGRAAAAGIMNMYAADSPLCPSAGNRRQPKFSHLEALHEAIRNAAPVLLKSPTALFKNQSVGVRASDGTWQTGTQQNLFLYSAKLERREREVAFVENNANVSHVVRVPLHKMTRWRTIEMEPYSAVMFVDGIFSFDSAALDPRASQFKREYRYATDSLLDWLSWKEPVGVTDRFATTADRPLEQTALNDNASISSDYAWYETEFDIAVGQSLEQAGLVVETQQANAILVYIDGEYRGEANTHFHKEGSATLNISLGSIQQGRHKLGILSESLGYGNLIGRWGATTQAKTKGLTGDVRMLGVGSKNVGFSLIDGRPWKSMAGLNGERLSPQPGIWRRDLVQGLALSDSWSSGGLWSSALFDTPRYDSYSQSLFVDTHLGRGHLWLNGIDLGRFWNITRGNSSEYSQRYYFLPPDWFYRNGRLNELVFFDATGGNYRGPRLVTSWVTPAGADEPGFQDVIGYPEACL